MWKKTFHVDDDLLRQFILMVMITWDSLQGSSWWSWLLRKGSVHTLGNGSVRFQPVWLWGVFSPIPHLVESNVLGDVLSKLGGVAGLSRYRHYQSDRACVWFYSESFWLSTKGRNCETCLRGWRTCSGRSSSPWSTWSQSYSVAGSSQVAASIPGIGLISGHHHKIIELHSHQTLHYDNKL